jgi:hypothetical protein
MNDLKELWDDQAAFNRLLRALPANEDERMQQTREIVLHLESELHELLATYSWKFHRNRPHVLNTAQREEELVDIFKFFLTLAQIQGTSVDSLVEAYWRKTAVVRQRYAQEWVHRVNRPYVVVDIDGVLCDYAAGFSQWIINRTPGLVDEVARQRTLDDHRWLDAESIGITRHEWATHQHEFRVTGGNRALPAFMDAVPFLRNCRAAGYLIVLLTSRPIDRYPNIYTDTVQWLTRQGMEFDIVWWAQHKGDFLALQSMPHDWFRFYVDDDLTFVQQVAKTGYAPVYWLRRGMDAPPGLDVGAGVIPVSSLTQVVRHVTDKEVL